MDLLDRLKKAIPHHMDFEGQQKAERIFQVLLVVHGIVGFIAGYVSQQYSYAVYTLGLGFVLSCLIVLPPWPCFRRRPVNWLKPIKTNEAAAATQSKKKKK